MVVACTLYNDSASELIRFIRTSGATAFRCDEVIEGLLTTGTWFSLDGGGGGGVKRIRSGILN